METRTTHPPTPPHPTINNQEEEEEEEEREYHPHFTCDTNHAYIECILTEPWEGGGGEKEEARLFSLLSLSFCSLLLSACRCLELCV